MGEEASPSSSCSLSLHPQHMGHNRVHHKGVVYPLGHFCRRIFNCATAPWEGAVGAIEMVVGWERLPRTVRNVQS